MSYTSLVYFLLITITCVVYYIVKTNYRWIVLLMANFVFYASAGWDNLIFLVISIIITYFVSVKMSNLQNECKEVIKQGEYDRKEKKEIKETYKKKQRRYLQVGLFTVIGILVVVKYTNFILGNVYNVLDLFGVSNKGTMLGLIVPLGISFYTFQMIAYLMDVYNGEEAQRNFFKYALYSSFFPSVVQGPIPRYHHLGEQLFVGHAFQIDNIRIGVMQILWGLVKKLVLAEKLAVFVNKIYGNYESYEGVILMVATAAFSIQIYADFAGCMDIVTGTARLFGIRLQPNFIRPYFSKTMPEFWRRWHASLGSWFKDYVFYPFSISDISLKLNKNARNKLGNEAGRIIAASMPILVVWSLTGIWHGAEWKYVAWGLFHGMLIILSTIFTPYNDKLSEKLKINRDAWWFRLFQMARTFVLCCVGRVFFRAANIGAAVGIFKQTFATTGVWRIMGDNLYKYGLSKRSCCLVVILTVALLVASVLEERSKSENIIEIIDKKHVVIRFVVAYILLFTVLLFGTYGPGDQAANFIYEQF
ncbi:MAG: MBOAT family protein [Lachnospiraceae bacterium]|nr:MBOAT family protein [Lachnospiraceae bacterium]